jgi:hypothetical protein
MSDLKVSQTFKAAATEYAAALLKSEERNTVKAHAVMTLVAIGFLSKMTSKEINLRGREVSGATEDTWNAGKSEYSKAWRSIAGEYGAREVLAEMWARKDYTISLEKAYALSAGPAKTPDVIAVLAKKLSTLTSEQVQDVMLRYLEICETLAYSSNDIQALVKLNIAEILSVSKAA